jgi:hypothetical protein
MASFAHALKSFRSGTLSQDKLIAEIERILADGRGDETWLLGMLDEEHARAPLPAEVHAAVKQRIEQSAAAKRQNAEGQAAVGGDFVDPDASRTCLATQFVGDGEYAQSAVGTQAVPPPTSGKSDAGSPPDFEKIKGVGDVLNGRFVLEERIGSGGMSTVYKALDRRKLEADDRNPYVAVKVLNVEFRSHPQSLIALQREAKKSQSLAHPNIVRVYDFDRDGSTVYMTMEYLSGKSLAQIFRARDFKGMSQEEAMPILEQIAAALKFAHDNRARGFQACQCNHHGQRSGQGHRFRYCARFPAARPGRHGGHAFRSWFSGGFDADLRESRNAGAPGSGPA